MDGSDQEQHKHACRVCNRSFPCGRSLGGHMRYHISTNSPSEVAEEKPPPPRPKQSQSSGGLLGIGTSYGVRENPKKTWRTHESIGISVCTEQEKLCNQCGKGFPSWRALFGHMRCHSPRPSPTLGRHQEQEEPAAEQRKEEEEGEEEEGGGGSWDSATVGVALCLMMLSRNVGFCDPSDENSALLEEREGIAELGKRRDVAQEGDRRVEKKSLSRKRKFSAVDDEFGRDPTMPPHKKNTFQCRACGKAFHSHQALGGHRAGHKRRRRHFVVGSDAGGFDGRHHQTAALHRRHPELRPPPPGALDLNLPAVADEDFAMTGVGKLV